MRPSRRAPRPSGPFPTRRGPSGCGCDSSTIHHTCHAAAERFGTRNTVRCRTRLRRGSDGTHGRFGHSARRPVRQDRGAETAFRSGSAGPEPSSSARDSRTRAGATGGPPGRGRCRGRVWRRPTAYATRTSSSWPATAPSLRHGSLASAHAPTAGDVSRTKTWTEPLQRSADGTRLRFVTVHCQRT